VNSEWRTGDATDVPTAPQASQTLRCLGNNKIGLEVEGTPELLHDGADPLDLFAQGVDVGP
jgi:hypothetical protein